MRKIEYYKLNITCTGKPRRNSKYEEYQTFDRFQKSCKTIAEIKEVFIERYGEMPSTKKKVYQELKDGTSQEIGFTHSFENADYSHAPIEKWYQTDWIEITKVTEEYVLL